MNEPAPAFQRRLGLFDAAMLVAGSMIGSGIYIVSSEISRDVGGAGWLLTVWGIAGVMTVLGALAYGELAAMMPHAGGQYVYLREAYGPLPGFLYGWTSFVVIQTGTIAAVGVAFAKFLGVLVPSLGTGPEAVLAKWTGLNWVVTLPLPWLAEPLTVFKRSEFSLTAGQLVGVASIIVLTWWNARGIHQGKLLQNVFTVAKIVSLAMVVIIGLFVTANPAIWSANFAQPWSPIETTKQFETVSKLVPNSASLVAWMVVGGALVGALFSADAWNNVTFTAGEVRNPQRNLPLSLILGTGGVILLYMLANVGYLASLPVNRDVATAIAPTSDVVLRGIDQADNDRIGTALMQMISPTYGTAFMAVLIMISTFGANNGIVLMGARLTYAMSRDGLFFGSVGKLNANGVPAVGLWLQAIWASVLTFSGTYGELLDYVIFAALLFYALTVGGLFLLRFRQPNADRPYKALGYPILPGIYLILCTAVMLNLLMVKPNYTWPGLILVLSGIPVYLLWRLIRQAPN